METGRRENMPQQREVMVLLIIGSLLAACSKGLPPSLMPAVMKADSKDVQALLRKRADANEKDSRGMTALMIAAERGNADIVQALLDKGADVHAKESRQGRTALLLAVGHKEGAIFQNLLDKGGDGEGEKKKGL